MKKIIVGTGLLFLACFARSQNGLDSVIVEKYYVSNAPDSVGSNTAGGGTLPVGSITFRIYVDLKPGYKFQALYGTEDAQGNPLHALLLRTTTSFFNNEDRGDKVPDGISVTNTMKNTVMLDSWFSVGATATGKIGLLKMEDTDGSIGNSDNLLTNNHPFAGIPITGTGAQDGMTVGTPQSVTFVGFTTELDVFDAISQQGDTFITTNGSIASLNGSKGPTATNRILVGQFTTDGTFCWELNMQIKDTVNNVIENYVAKNPTGLEMTHASLMGCDSLDVTVNVQNLINTIVPAFYLYPNPATANDVISMHILSSATGKASYAIYDLVGQQVFHKELGNVSVNHTEKISIASLSPGMYIVKLTINENTSSQPIIKN